MAERRNILEGSKDMICDCCGKQHHVFMYREEIPDYPAPANPDGITEYPTTRRYFHCSYKNKNFEPMDIAAENDTAAAIDFLKVLSRKRKTA